MVRGRARSILASRRRKEDCRGVKWWSKTLSRWVRLKFRFPANWVRLVYVTCTLKNKIGIVYGVDVPLAH